MLLCWGCQLATDPLERDFSIALRQVKSTEPPTKRKVGEALRAFDAVQAADYGRARHLDSLADPAKWPELYTLYADMSERLSAIAAYFPLGASSDYRGGYGLDEIATRRETARMGAGKYFLDLADAGIRAARAGSKPAARGAYYDLENAFFYMPERRSDLTAVREEMRYLGTVRVRVFFTGDVDMQAVAGEINDRLGPVREEWYEVDFRDTGTDVDIEAELQFTAYTSSGPSESFTSTTYQEEVLDYVEKQEYEERINDSTVVTKVREIEHYKIITATVTEVVQEFSLSAYGEISVFDPVEARRTRPEPLSGYALWENEYTTCSGEPDALPSFACSGSSSFPPSTNHMLREAVDDLLDAALLELRHRYDPDY